MWQFQSFWPERRFRLCYAFFIGRQKDNFKKNAGGWANHHGLWENNEPVDIQSFLRIIKFTAVGMLKFKCKERPLFGFDFEKFVRMLQALSKKPKGETHAKGRKRYVY